MAGEHRKYQHSQASKLAGTRRHNRQARNEQLYVILLGGLMCEEGLEARLDPKTT